MKRSRPVGLLSLLLLGACGSDAGPVSSGPVAQQDDEAFCTISTSELQSVLVPEAIRALEDPPLVSPDHPKASYVDDHDRVVGLLLDGQPVAVPLDMLRYHEVANFSRGEDSLIVTYCPLTGSSLVFDRSSVGGTDFGVSGLLYRNNLVFYDRKDPASFFAQMERGAALCGPRARQGLRLDAVPSIELRWDAWRRLHPGSLVVSSDPGPDVDFGTYEVNAYESYERIDNPFVLMPMDIDPRRPPKERVLGIPLGGDGGPVFPFEAMRGSERRAIAALQRRAVVFWDQSAEAAVAFSTEVDSRVLTFAATGGGYVDEETGSVWRLDGLAVSGALAGERLRQIPDAFVSFWFAWAAFFPNTVIWDGRSG